MSQSVAGAFGMDRAEEGARRATACGLFHPGVQAAYLICALVLAMASFQPVLVGVALAAGLAASFLLRGWRNALRSLAWQLPMVALIAVVNPLVSSSGSTELFRIGTSAVYLESFAYGLCMGAFFMEAVVWFSNAAHVMDSDAVMALSGRTLPTVTLMLSMAMRLVPQFVRRGGEVAAVEGACTAARPNGIRAGGRASAWARRLSVLMGWGMEDSLDMADAMRIRGWDAGSPRTRYRARAFRVRDGAALAVVAVLTLACAFVSWRACSGFSFYPRMSALGPWWGYAVWAAFYLLPLATELIERARWAAWAK